ncbi:hypothetical protein K7X08_038065 [Anisodus acutangulus]|uniref:Pentatricopeptide repeat-containing protein n=1 Tax=Anisodus acutangulus TaxID=402998 RepID=A0A9Q1RT78_9SOLA|nr:hypothetical protein K7X08_038065 [Anisodus acutangulus]
MRRKGICPNIVTYTSVIKCLCTCGRLEDAELLLEQMVSNGVTPTSATYNCFFKEFKGRKDVDGALRLYGKMKEGSLCSPSMHELTMKLVLQKSQCAVLLDAEEYNITSFGEKKSSEC